MDMHSFKDVEHCVNKTFGSSGSDNLISQCLWQFGHAFLDPGAWVEHNHSFTFVFFVSGITLLSRYWAVAKHSEGFSGSLHMLPNTAPDS